MAAGDGLILVRPSTAFRLYLYMQKNDGTLVETSWTGASITVNKDAATSSIADTPHQIGTTGWGYVDFTGVEIGTAKVITGYWTVTNSGAIPTPFSMVVVADDEIPVYVKAISDGLLTAAKFASDFFQTIWDKATSALTTPGSIGKFLVDNVTAILAKTNTIGTSTAFATSPTVAPNTVRIVFGDAYSASDGRAIDLVYSGQPDFTGGQDVTLKAVKSEKEVGTAIVTWTGAVLNSTTLRFTPDSTDTSDTDLRKRDRTQMTFPMEVSLTLSGRTITPTSLHVGRLIVDQEAA